MDATSTDRDRVGHADAREADLDPRVRRSRALVVDAAWEEFIEHGYLATSLDDVARRAGIAKRTIYNVIGGKEDLFRAVMAEAIDTAERYSVEIVGELGTGGDVHAELHEAGQRLAQAVLSGRVVAIRRLLIAEAARFPILATDYYERAPGRVIEALSEAFRRYHDRELLRVDEPALAGEQFAFLVLGASLDRAMFTADATSPSPDLVDARARAGVEVFLRAHLPDDDTS